MTDVTTSSLRLNWEAPPGAFDSFLLRYGVPSSTLEPHPWPLLQRELTVPGTRHSAALRDLRPGTLYSFTLYGLRGPHKADSIQGTARTLSPGKAPTWTHIHAAPKWQHGVEASASARGEASKWWRAWGNLQSNFRFCVWRKGVMASMSGASGAPGEGGMGILGQEPLCPRPLPLLLGTPHSLVLESPRDLQFSEIGETSAKVSWMPPPSRVDSFKVSYQLADGGDTFLPMTSLALISPEPSTLPVLQLRLASLGNLPSPSCFQGSHRACG